ncbi:MAG TPA: hypothetical protein VG165_00135 [Solirubrobacteraceae bacterium]|jgi:hypothetical protein|nr:hypothetical protein [Solirubrobacteraceae bacterium]
MVAALVVTGSALAASAVRPAGHADRAALIRALVRQDGSSAGVTSTYISRSSPTLAVVCQLTPDSGKVAYVFRRSGRTWSYVTNSRSGRPKSSAQRSLEATC